MIPELGHFAIILALCFAVLQSVRGSIFFVLGQFAFLAFAMLCLIISFLNSDMSVVYVQQHSQQSLPFFYKVGAAWGGHEGSLLLWCLILSGWTLLFSLVTLANPEINKSRITAILGMISTGFVLFLLFTSDPFMRIFPTALVSGNDLTPILQDPGLIFHPPMLYLGYVGFALGFAFAISALIEGNFDKHWVQACRPWIILPWAFLSCGIVLGSWWAYRELGWGGWWFWDPVENASLLPWLAATALIHSLIVSEKRNVFKGWTILLALVTFALSLLGTFLVRSGVLVSVHAFASDPTRGLFLLCYLTLIIGGSLSFYALRIKQFYQPPAFSLFSRETFLLINTVIMLTAVATILLGTLYPIILEALNLGKISVGEPYFNTVFLPIILPLLLLMGIAPHVNWGQQQWVKLQHKLQLNFIIIVFIAVVSPMLLGFSLHWLTTCGIAFSLWIISATLQYIWESRAVFGFKNMPMVIAHIGIAVLALGITVNKSYSEERQIKMQPGDVVSLAGYQFYFNKLEDTHGPNYQSITATFAVRKPSGRIEFLTAEQRFYSHEQTLSKPGTLVNPFRDLYLALGAPISKDDWSVRIYYKPLVRWIWAGGFMLLIGGVLSLFRKKVRT